MLHEINYFMIARDCFYENTVVLTLTQGSHVMCAAFAKTKSLFFSKKKINIFVIFVSTAGAGDDIVLRTHTFQT